jgi:cytochrome c553
MQKMICAMALALWGGIGVVHAADLAAGQAKSALCVACHNANGISSNPLYPNLAGQQSAYLVKQMQAFRGGQRVNATMTALAKLLSDADIQNLAAYYSALPRCSKVPPAK